MNPSILPVVDGFPIAQEVQRLLGQKAVAANDANAAAWGEFVYGAGQGQDMAFVTLSTGIGGGLVLGGKLVSGRFGLAGEIGQIPSSDGGAWYEDVAAGRWIAAEAGRLGFSMDARGVFTAASSGEPWAESILQTSASRIGAMLRTIRHVVDPDVFVIGGGLGLAPGFLERIQNASTLSSPAPPPRLVPAALGTNAGVVGIAHLATNKEAQS